MNLLRNRVSGIFTCSSASLNSVSWELQQCRGIRVKVFNNNLERALAVMQRMMVSSGIERLIKRRQPRHIKNSEKRVLANKALAYKIRSQKLNSDLRSILVKKVRGL